MEIPLNIRLAVRNIFRNRVRSAITLAAIAFGSVSLILAGGFFEDTFLQMREAVIHSSLGHIQVYKKGFLEKGGLTPFDYLIEDPEAKIKYIESLEHVKLVTPRITFSGLISTGENTCSVIGQGIDPEGEEILSIITTVKGAHTGVAIQAGKKLLQNDKYEVIVGRGLARTVGLKVGDYITLVSTTVNGALNAMDMKVKGIFFTASKEFDDRAVRIPITTAQNLLRTEKVETLVVLLDRTENTDVVRNSLLNLFKEKHLDLELRPWYEMADFYKKTVELYGRQFLVLKLIIAIIVVLGIFNTINMSIWERTREIGTLMALGTRRREILKLFLMEGFILGIIGGLIGTLAGIGLAQIISYIGIPMPPPPGATVGWTAHIRVVPQLLSSSFSMAVLSSLASSFYPAFKASRLVIADALRHI